MSRTPLLDDLVRTSDGTTKSPLAAIFGPNIAFREISHRIMGQLINDDFNALRRTNSTMNSNLTMADERGRFLYPGWALRDKCDAVIPTGPFRVPWHVDSMFDLRPPLPTTERCCQNEPKSEIRLTRCSRQPDEEGFYRLPSEQHKKDGGLALCSTCHYIGKYHTTLYMQRNMMWSFWEIHGKSQWTLCAICEYKKERENPEGGQFCDCFNSIKRRVLCYPCLYQREKYLLDIYHNANARRLHVWRDEVRKEINFKRNDPKSQPFCLECGVSPSLPEHRQPQTRICIFCRKCTIRATSSFDRTKKSCERQNRAFPLPQAQALVSVVRPKFHTDIDRSVSLAQAPAPRLASSTEAMNQQVAPPTQIATRPLARIRPARILPPIRRRRVGAYYTKPPRSAGIPRPRAGPAVRSHRNQRPLPIRNISSPRRSARLAAMESPSYMR